jgi:16S rRNA processing protein RimM
VAEARAPQRVCVAKIGAPHGVRGEVKLHAFTADPMSVREYGALETGDGLVRLKIHSIRPSKGHLIARFAGIDDREAAERLTNQKLYVPRARLPAPEAGEFYHADLIGLAAVDAGGAPLGSVVAIHNFGAGDLIEIAPAQGGATVMIPFTEAVVPTIDVAGGRIVIDPPQGMFTG